MDRDPSDSFDVVLDTNVVLALWHFRDPRLPVLRAALDAGTIRPVSRGDALEELRQVLGRPVFGVAPERQQTLLSDYRARCRVLPGDVAVQAALPICRDPDDQKFLQIARAGAAACLVTRDRALLRLAGHRLLRGTLRVISPERLECELGT